MDTKATILVNASCILLCCGCGYYVYHLDKTQTVESGIESSAQIDRFDSEISELEGQLATAQQEKATLEAESAQEKESLQVVETEADEVSENEEGGTEISEETASESTISLIFFTGEENIYPDVIDILKGNGSESPDYTGMLAIGEVSYPGFYWEGMSWQECQKLVNSGWTTCLYWGDGKDPQIPDQESITSWYRRMQDVFHEIDEEMPDIIYFESGTYTSEINTTLKELGISTIIHHGENDLPIADLSVDENNGITQIGDISWEELDDKVFADLEETFGSVCVSFEGDMAETDVTDGNDNCLERIIEFIRQEEANGLQVVDVKTASAMGALLEKEQKEYELQQARIKSKLENEEAEKKERQQAIEESQQAIEESQKLIEEKQKEIDDLKSRIDELKQEKENSVR